MHPDKPKAPREGRQPAPQQRGTPDTDMQPEDAGTPESQPAAAGTPAESTLKQQDKNDTETGSRR
ncbi:MULTISPECIES: hypothetical protein [Ramlibacter]|jgi:hypothetical protein|uniref:Uncharacterized protein n=1 Tax=Ramlibacter pinisoli TaxID=2682844 RepID=A0A6N8IQD1_9BURK|nr:MULTISPECIES: hypothetical protein [Ramlibacter]MBA2964048.1 hypothetical protein [Ramlibacter sp. CGMCC 1.13660]MVQ29014.1 hypothetical protein [Ramlibacter pinisoli]